ncbi:MAG: hypothetical protein BWX88_04972 [Planctomycetes bacterium ADurb.Bin126]|nr:MAG: hypothetical protein BWX88_04972 [Planctomycetes bacterium ADurb.Bin126]HOD81036.1 twin-arginine translocation signal domain-containing protein [Phycisphaerae bacterium]HQL75672.1 twin-arginine translocation signal domain-containing protein [Phycisphaerae bacterium]
MHSERDDLDRRGFLSYVCAAAAAGGAAATVAPARDAAPAEPGKVADPSARPAQPLPTGKIGKLELSRLMLGTNHITFYMHSRDLRYVDDLSRAYNSDEKILETFATAEANGINTFVTHQDAKIAALFKRHRAGGGKLRWVVAPWLDEDGRVTEPSHYVRVVPKLVDQGVDALYVPGMIAGEMVKKGAGPQIADMLETIRAAGLPAGVACHELFVVEHCEKHKLPVDFYVKTFHHLRYPSAPKPENMKGDYAEVPGYWCSNPDQTAAFMKTVAKPWIAFKVMAAGAIPPQDAFHYAYHNGADFILAGMFDFQIASDCQIARDQIAQAAKRPRPWCA